MPSTATDRLQGLSTSVAVKPPCITVATTNITLSGLQTISSVTVAEGDRVLVKGQSIASENGIYTASTGAWIRAKDFDGNRDAVSGTRVLIRNGGSDGIEYELTTADPIVIGTTSLTFVRRYGANATYDQTEAETVVGVTPTNWAYKPGHFKRYGAIDDGTDNATAWANMLKQAEQAGGAPAYIPASGGSGFKVNTGYTMTGTVQILGEGLANSVIYTTADITVLTIPFAASHSDVRDFTITGPGTGISTKPGVIANNSNGNTFKRIKVHAFDKGIKFEQGIGSCYLNSLYDCQIISNKTINIEGEPDTNALFLSNCTLGGGPCATGLKLTNSNNLCVVGGDAEGLTLTVFDLDATGPTECAHYISGFHFEGNTCSAGDVRIGNTAAVNGVCLVGNLYAPGTGNGCAVNAIRGDGLAIIGGDLHSGYASGYFHKVGASFGAYSVAGVGNVKDECPINFRSTSPALAFMEATNFDAAYQASARFNSYRLASGSITANKSYFAGLDGLRVDSSGGLPGAGNKLYARAAIVNNGQGSETNARAFLAGGAFDQTEVTLTYGASITPNASTGNLFVITITNANAHTINAPANPVQGQVITFTLRNTSGGAAGVATWNAAFKMAAWTQAATANSRSITFKYNGTNWVEISRTAADVPN